MAIEIVATAGFIKDLKAISKKHKSISVDMAVLSAQLKENPTMGTHLAEGIYKIRLSISGTNKGKSGGARVITCVVLIKETVFLAQIYLKNEYDTVDPAIILQRLTDEGIL